ncbi:uncharacterized protein [Littorina saxatilis]|uniref:uncharacterized protein isoform X3 n=1 Tax=Littorina saxatilis TaxID=31220 RepID=UPI0038B4BF50
MALLRHRTKRHISSRDRSASVDSGLDTPSLADKNSHDVIASDVFDEVSRYNSSEFVAPEHGRHRSSTNTRGVFAAYINNKFQTHDESGNNSSRIVLSSARDSISNQDDVDTLLTSEPHIHDVRTFPDHLDSFADVADAIIGRLRKKKKSDNDESDDVFDDRWHSGHEDGDDCPFCEEFSRATKRRVDRVFGGTESFLGWIFSKWGKRKELEGVYRRSNGVRGRSAHFCNFVSKAGMHSRLEGAHARTGSDDEYGLDYTSEAKYQDLLAQWRRQRGLTGSGTEGRPGSPTSMDGRNGLRDVNDDDAMSVKIRQSGSSISPQKTKMIPTIIIPPTDQDLIHRSRADQSSARKSAREDTRPNESSRRKSADRPVSASRSTHKEKETPDKNKRTPIAKKKKKTSCKSRKSKAADMEDAPAEALASGDASQAPVEDASQPTANGLDVTGKVPDLPELSTSGKKNGRKGKKSGRRMMSPPPVGDKLRPPSELLDLDTNSRTGYDFGDMDSTDTETKNNKPRVQSLINTRMALSLKSSRFELPMDMKDLEKMCPQDYLRKFCVVSSRRLNLYQKVFVKHKDKTNHIKKDKLEMCLKETLVQSLKPNTFGDLCDLLEVDDATFIDFKLFSGIAAITERILYPFYTTEDTLEKPEYQRERIEAADFEALDWKLKGIEVKDKLRKLLKTIE